VSSHSSLPISWSISSSNFIKDILDIRHLQYDARRQIIGRATFHGQWTLGDFWNVSAPSRCASGFFCE
jgi:hypothetical protein